jgi:hypothetical protein
MAEIARYKPADIIRWLEIGADTLRTPSRRSARDMKGVVAQAMTRVLDVGKSAVADVGARGLARLEYRVHPDGFEALTATSRKTVPFGPTTRIQSLRRGGFRISTEGTSISVRHYAWLVVSGIKVPLGWRRNGMEVPFDLLLEEVAARSKAPIEQA